MSEGGYQFKLGPEVLWAVGTALVVVLAEALVTFDAQEVLTDPKTWAVGLVTSTFRSIGAALINGMRRAVTS